MTRIYHNPRCSKSRAALQLIRDQGVDPEVVLYLEDAPGRAEIAEICERLGVEPAEITRTGDRNFRDLGLSAENLQGREDWIDLLARYPILIERPIVIRGDRAVVGRPPETVLDLF